MQDIDGKPCMAQGEAKIAGQTCMAQGQAKDMGLPR